MKKALTLLLIFTLLVAKADEGMWLPSLLEAGAIKDMRAKGLRLTAKDLYDVNQACLKDAVVRFGMGCTGEVISEQGLLLTNHHCGYSQIQSHSSFAKDYLTNGFAAGNQSQELPNPGLKVYFLRQMSDVTAEVLKGINEKMTPEERDTMVEKNSRQIVSLATNNSPTTTNATVNALYYGNQYFLFVYDVFQDVRLVFAPPSSIGKFGGDTDNWMWPRHTGDFSIFRIYASKDNKPAAYSKNNIPYKPKKSLTISSKGVKDGDFTFVYGFPARTQQYLHSEAVRYILEQQNPVAISLRTTRLEVMNAAQAADAEVRIKYAAKNASVSNAWKKWQGESLGLKRLGTVNKKRAQEQKFEQWASDKPQYKGITDRLGLYYDSIAPYNIANTYFNEAALAVEALKFAGQQTITTDDIELYIKNYVRTIDSTTSVKILPKFMEGYKEFLPQQYAALSVEELQRIIFENSIFSRGEQLKALASKSQKIIDNTIEKDPVRILAQELIKNNKEKVLAQINIFTSRINELYKSYMKAMMEMEPQRVFAADANSTLRVAYGTVKGYEPRDGVYYRPLSTLEGVMQKDNPEIYDYDVPERLRELYRTKDYGRWTVNGTVPVAFLATNHTTGGNSGSPVLNSNGELVGINFDRVWEGTMSDMEFDPTVCRNISLDIRYMLFLVDKFAGAKYLLEEMDIK
ncbi:MAG: S46 family peptidase [Mucinivorans sp.]